MVDVASMKFMGGKSRSAKQIVGVIERARSGRTTYVEPFLGGAAIAARVTPLFESARLSDVVPDLIMMWQAVAEGWEPPVDLSFEEYRSLRHAEPSPLRAFAGFGCSFGGRWFEGYGRQRIAGGKPAVETTLAPGARRSILRKAPGLAGAVIERLDYRSVEVNRDCLVYADPPYRDTKTYGASGKFDSDLFWDVAATWSAQGAAVLVSEHVAPPFWIEVWSQSLPIYLRGHTQVTGGRTERLFADPVTASQLESHSVT